MYQTHTKNEKILLFFKIFLPILVYQLANYSASFVDTTMTGQYNAKHLAGVSLATNLWSPFFTFLTGIVSALVPIIGQHLGKQETGRIQKEVQQFFYLALGLSVILFLLVFGLAPMLLDSLKLEPILLEVAKTYLFYLSIGILPLLLFSVIRSFLDALGLTGLSMALMLCLLPLNASFNAVLIYGLFGFREMGGAGAGLGTALAYWVLLILASLLLVLHPKTRTYKLFHLSPPDWQLLKEGLKLGLPIGGTVFAEVAIFATVGIFMAKFSPLVIAAHQSAMNFATLMYAFPMSISTAMAILVSYEVGAGRRADVRDYCRIGRLTAAGFASLTLIFLYLFRYQVASLYGRDVDFLQLTTVFLTYSLFFQLADTFAAPLQGILRGYKDTEVPFYLGLISYWGVTLPLALALETWTDLGPYAYWVGLIAALIVSGLAYQVRLKIITKAN